MKKIINFSLNNKFAIWILTFMAIFMGIFSGLNMKQELMPNINLPVLSIVTTYPGAAPDEVMEKVTEPIEQRVQNVQNIELVSSSSLANASSVQLEFDFNTDMDQAVIDVEEALEGLSLPEGVQDPNVMSMSFDALPILSLSISDSGHSPEELTSILENIVIPAIEGIEGVAEVQIAGQQLKEVSVKFDEEKLMEFGLTEETITQLIQGSNITFPLGLTNFDGHVKNLILDGSMATIEDLKKLEIPVVPKMSGNSPEEVMNSQMLDEEKLQQVGGIPGAELVQQAQDSMEMPTIQLGELANIEVVDKVESISRTNGEPSISIQIIKTPDANTVEVVNQTKEAFADFEKEFGFTVVTTLDQAEPIEDSVNSMLSKALYGIIFAIIVIMLFLRSIKTTLISVVSIPLSLLIALFFLYQMDISLNMLTLGALTIAIGRVIDDSIVVMENIYRRMSLPGEKLRGKDLIREATRQMFVPIFSSTIVTIAVFLPIALIGGMVGELFLPFALAVVFALSASLLIAVTIVPLLAHTLFKKQLAEDMKEKVKEQKVSTSATIYKRILEWTLDHKWITFGGASFILVLSLFLLPVIGVNFISEDEQKMVIATYSPAIGQTMEETEKITLDTEEMLEKREGVTLYQYSIGGGNPMGAMMGANNDNSALFFIEYDNDFKDFAEESKKIIEVLNDNTDSGEWDSLEMGSIGGSGLEIYVYGDRTEDIQTAVDQILPHIEEHADLEKAKSSITDSYDQYTLIADQEKLSQFGLVTAQVGMALASSSEADILTTIQHDGQDVNVYIDINELSYDSLKELEDIEIKTPLGMTIKVGDVVDIEEGVSPDTIDRRENKMYAAVTADIIGNDVASVTSNLENKLNELDLPEGVSFEFGGVTEQITESFTQLGFAMLAAVAIIYFILVVTFGGALAPFSILFSLPFIAIGSLVALWIAGEPLGVPAMIGALMLIGIVVTNAIVLIDRVIRNEKDGLTTREALLEAGGTRLRPILMTALATIGALIPLAFGEDSGGLISKGLGVTVMGGLASSTLLTLVIVPIVYEVFTKFRKTSPGDK
ncbi:efflux RND transporter permease subunit [Oceanobacillus sp. HCA-5259]|uniref:efflux RND transporter permease subunit n=1 Tax=Oceanobacillus sp. HCA-5259 TaxID=3134661 RepID=UPI0030C101B0